MLKKTSVSLDAEDWDLLACCLDCKSMEKFACAEDNDDDLTDEQNKENAVKRVKNICSKISGGYFKAFN